MTVAANNGLYVIRDVTPHIPSVPTLAKDIAKRVGCWTPESIALALRTMFERGEVQRVTITDDHGFSRHMYWRA